MTVVTHVVPRVTSKGARQVETYFVVFGTFFADDIFLIQVFVMVLMKSTQEILL